MQRLLTHYAIGKHIPAVSSIVDAALSAAPDRLESGELCAIFDPQGRLEYATTDLWDRLSHLRLERIRRSVLRLHFHPLHIHQSSFTSADYHLLRFLSPFGISYALILYSPPLPHDPDP